MTEIISKPLSTSNETIRDFIIESDIPTRRGDQKILLDHTFHGYHDAVNLLIGDHVDEWEPELAKFREMIKSITSIEDLTKVHWMVLDSEMTSDPDGLQDCICPSSLHRFGLKTLHLKVSKCHFIPYNQFFLEIWWDETGAIIAFDDGPCVIEFICYKVE